jgi:Rnl2 family RNA ligase
MTSSPAAAFKSYDSISNKVGAHMAPEAKGPEVPWVATHKIDGKNMSVTITRRPGDATPTIQFGRRNGFLGADTSFDGYQAVLPGLADWAAVLGDFPEEVSSVTIFGELYGGGYPHPDVPAVVPAPGLVQRSVFYAPDKRFVAFDVRLDNDRYLDYPEAAALLDRHHIPRVHTVFSGPYEEVVAWATSHRADDVNPAWFGLPHLPVIAGNAGEGWVVRPEREAHNVFSERLLFKVKNPAFDEVAAAPPASAKAKAAAKGKEPPMSRFVTASRVSNVLGKELPETVTKANFKALVELVVDDAVKDGASAEEDRAATTRAASALVGQHLRTLGATQ